MATKNIMQSLKIMQKLKVSRNYSQYDDKSVYLIDAIESIMELLLLNAK